MYKFKSISPRLLRHLMHFYGKSKLIVSDSEVYSWFYEFKGWFLVLILMILLEYPRGCHPGIQIETHPYQNWVKSKREIIQVFS